MITYNKRKASLSLEFALLIPIILSVFMALFSIIYTVNIKAEIDRGVNKALEDISSEIYLSSRIIEDSGSFEKINDLIKPLNQYLGLDLDLSAALNKTVLKMRIRQKTYSYLGFDKLPFWLKEDIDFDLAYSSNTLIVSSKSKIKLPVLSNLLGEIVFEKNHIQAARGINKLLDSENNKKKSKDKNKITITICQYSYNGKSKSPVYHSRKCMGRRNEKAENSINFELNKNDVAEDGVIRYKGKEYRYCKFCKKMEEKGQ